MGLNRKGQALIEFVLILPVFLLILFTIVDFGMLIHTKNQLENSSSDIIRLVENGGSIEDVRKIYKDIDVKIEEYEVDYKKIIILDSVSFINPIIIRILGDPYQVVVERVIPNV